MNSNRICCVSLVGAALTAIGAKFDFGFCLLFGVLIGCFVFMSLLWDFCREPGDA